MPGSGALIKRCPTRRPPGPPLLVHSQVEPVRGDFHTPGCQPRPTLPSSPSEGPIPCPPPGPCSLPAGPGPPVASGHLPRQLPGSPAWPSHRQCGPCLPIPRESLLWLTRGQPGAASCGCQGLFWQKHCGQSQGSCRPGTRGPISSHCWLEQTQCPAKAVTPNWPPQGPLVQAKPRRGYQ